MTDERRSGTTRLHGRPLDDNGAIDLRAVGDGDLLGAPFTPSKIAQKIVNATGLDPEKIYILEADREKVSTQQLREVMEFLHTQGIRGICVQSHGGDGIRVLEPSPLEVSRD